jgi:hypothetical protein
MFGLPEIVGKRWGLQPKEDVVSRDMHCLQRRCDPADIQLGRPANSYR